MSDVYVGEIEIRYPNGDYNINSYPCSSHDEVLSVLEKKINTFNNFVNLGYKIDNVRIKIYQNGEFKRMTPYDDSVKSKIKEKLC